METVEAWATRCMICVCRAFLKAASFTRRLSDERQEGRVLAMRRSEVSCSATFANGMSRSRIATTLFLMFMALAAPRIAFAQSDPAALSVEQLRKASAAGQADAQAELGRRLIVGDGVAQDLVDAVRWIRLAADQGNATGQGALGYMYEKGFGVRQDFSEARRYYTPAVAQNDGRAKLGLSRLLLSGLGGPREPAEALKLLRTLSDPEAALLAGTCVGIGDCAARNPATAQRLYQRAAEGGHNAAKALLGSVTSDNLDPVHLALLYQRFVLDTDALKPRDTQRHVLTADERFVEQFPSSAPLELIARIASKRGPVLLTITNGGFTCGSLLQSHVVTSAIDELLPADPSKGAAIVDFRVSLSDGSPMLKERAATLASSIKLDDYGGAKFGEPFPPVTIFFDEGEKGGGLSVLQSTQDSDSQKWPAEVESLRRSYVSILKKRGHYSVLDDSAPATAEALTSKQRLANSTRVVDDRIKLLELTSQCYAQAAAKVRGEISAIDREIKENNDFIQEASELLGRPGVRTNAKGQLQFVDEDLEVAVRIVERKTGEQVDRMSKQSIDAALTRLRTLTFTREEREEIRKTLRAGG